MKDSRMRCVERRVEGVWESNFVQSNSHGSRIEKDIDNRQIALGRHTQSYWMLIERAVAMSRILEFGGCGLRMRVLVVIRERPCKSWEWNCETGGWKRELQPKVRDVRMGEATAGF
ncbi:hypothetical protein PV327_003738 [Microctonus hyperodae]|uniref:Uncharacterized protein n=1 Tax=Microctonus hyperodae TaxID=165561 RepID=A0AA39L1H5_MICHY|nr:hypothetical protein PV327_003738 [Microctonus hyperodae]